jgi:hypothetical protein
MIPLDTLQFLNSCLKDRVIKLYIYLGQRWKYKQDKYTFTLRELGEHLGMNAKTYQRDITELNN